MTVDCKLFAAGSRLLFIHPSFDTFFFIICTVGGIKLGTISNDTELTLLSESFMVTQGEWTLIHIEIDKNEDSDMPTKVVYMVRRYLQ